MITSLGLTNIKCFSDENLKFAPYTILCGANSAGKSTIIQSLLLLKQSATNGAVSTGVLNLMGELYSIGHASDLINHFSINEKISIRINDTVFSQNLRNIDINEYSIPLELHDFSIDFFENDFQYLSAFRIGPQNKYELNYKNNKVDVGVNGEYAISILASLGNKPAINSKLATSILADAINPAKISDNHSTNLNIATKEAMRDIFPEVNFSAVAHPNFDQATNSFYSGNTTNPIRPINTGFGLSYVLPIIVISLSMKEGGILIIENPEVHLHPQAQSKLAAFLYRVSLSGIQVIIETHSDHIINGARVFSKENTIEEGHVVINSIKMDNSKTTITEITIGSDGSLSDVDDGFLDQIEKDLVRLF